MSYRMKVHVDDMREGEEMNLSGIRKIRNELVSNSNDPSEALAEFAEILNSQKKADRLHIAKVQIMREGGDQDSKDFSLS